MSTFCQSIRNIFLQKKKRDCSKNIRIQTENYKFSRKNTNLVPLWSERRRNTQTERKIGTCVCVCESQSVLSPKDSKSLNEIPALFGFCFLDAIVFLFALTLQLPSLRLCIFFKIRLRFCIDQAIASSITNAQDIDNNLWIGFHFFFFSLLF